MTITSRLFGSLWLLLQLTRTTTYGKQSSVTLTKENFGKTTKGKTVFIKFFAPWCGHCQELEPKWELMAQEWIDHEQGLVGQVDCTKEKKFCQQDFAIEGLPTLLYGDPSGEGIFLQEYGDDKSYEALSQFANETLAQPFCSPGSIHVCDNETQKTIHTFMSMSLADTEQWINDKERELIDAEKWFQHEFQRMQKEYNTKSTDYEFLAAQIKANIKMIKSVQAAKVKM
mmetsp:Transcript_3470/g.5906  ORF Transcript_3470/g.5906 Transcript_3470/m.5906 type:complete len:228 (+) Transcript_3470:2-685(+)